MAKAGGVKAVATPSAFPVSKKIYNPRGKTLIFFRLGNFFIKQMETDKCHTLYLYQKVITKPVK